MPPVIDAHQHFWEPGRLDHPWLTEAFEPLQRAFIPDDLEPELRLEGMTGTILVQLAPSHEETARLLALASDLQVRTRELPAGTYTDAIDAVRYLIAELPTLQRDEIRGGTAERVYRLTRM